MRKLNPIAVVTLLIATGVIAVLWQELRASRSQNRLLRDRLVQLEREPGPAPDIPATAPVTSTSAEVPAPATP